MLSRLRCVQSSIQTNVKRYFSKKTQANPTAKTTTASREEFIDASRFKDDILMLYRSQEANSSRFVSGGLLSLGLYDAYQYYQGEDTLFSSIDGMTALATFAFLALFELKLHKTPKSISLDKDGRRVFLELYRFLGFGSKVIQLEVRDFRGYGPYIKKYNKIPIAMYSDHGKKGWFFFKPTYILENDYLRKVFSAYNFKVGNSELNVNISKKARSKYDV